MFSNKKIKNIGRIDTKNSLSLIEQVHTYRINYLIMDRMDNFENMFKLRIDFLEMLNSYLSLIIQDE